MTCMYPPPHTTLLGLVNGTIESPFQNVRLLYTECLTPVTLGFRFRLLGLVSGLACTLTLGSEFWFSLGLCHTLTWFRFRFRLRCYIDIGVRVYA